MFERFTDPARQAVVYAQEEARRLNHNYIGTEHVLLGLVREGHGIASRVLVSMGVSLERLQAEVQDIIGLGKDPPASHIPFTPRAKKILELALREAHGLGHQYIGTEHLLLGLLAEGEGVGAQVLTKAGVDIDAARKAVLETLAGGGSPERVEQPMAVGVGPERARPYDPGLGPLCTMCKVPLREGAATTIIEAGEGDTHARLLVVYCRRCGDPLRSEILPEER